MALVSLQFRGLHGFSYMFALIPCWGPWLSRLANGGICLGHSGVASHVNASNRPSGRKWASSVIPSQFIMRNSCTISLRAKLILVCKKGVEKVEESFGGGSMYGSLYTCCVDYSWQYLWSINLERLLYFKLSFYYSHFHKKLSFYFVTNVQNISVQITEWFCWSNAIEIWNHQILDANWFVRPNFTS